MICKHKEQSPLHALAAPPVRSQPLFPSSGSLLSKSCPCTASRQFQGLFNLAAVSGSLPTVSQSKADEAAVWLIYFPLPSWASCVELPCFFCTSATRLVSWRQGPASAHSAPLYIWYSVPSECAKQRTPIHFPVGCSIKCMLLFVERNESLP